jgi:hypothetical protein
MNEDLAFALGSTPQSNSINKLSPLKFSPIKKNQLLPPPHITPLKIQEQQPLPIMRVVTNYEELMKINMNKQRGGGGLGHEKH